MAKNYDDHVKNISFLMDRSGKWSLSPAYDMTFSYNPNSLWTSQHQMKINGRRENIEMDDLIICGRNMDISNKRIKEILKQIIEVVDKWPRYAESAGVNEQHMEEIKRYHKYGNIFK